MLPSQTPSIMSSQSRVQVEPREQGEDWRRQRQGSPSPGALVHTWSCQPHLAPFLKLGPSSRWLELGHCRHHLGLQSVLQQNGHNSAPKRSISPAETALVSRTVSPVLEIHVPANISQIAAVLQSSSRLLFQLPQETRILVAVKFLLYRENIS